MEVLNMKLNKAIDKYLLDTQVRTSESNFSYEKSKCIALNKYIGKKNIRSINRDTINEYILLHRNFNPKISNKTLNKGVATLKRVVKYVSNRDIDYKKLKEKKVITPTVSKDNQTLIFEYLESRKFRGSGFRNLLLFRLLADTGLRLKEVRHLHINNLNIDNNSFTVTTTKADRDKIVYFSNRTSQLLEEDINNVDITDYI